MAFDSFTADEHFPQPIERRLEQTVISETKSNVDILHFLHDFPSIQESLNKKQLTSASAGPNWVSSYALNKYWNWIWTYAWINWAWALTIRNWEIISVK